MNHKWLYYVKNVSFIIVLILFAASFSSIGMVVDNGLDYRMIVAILFLCLTIQMIFHMVRHHEIWKNINYQVLFTLVNITFIYLYLRTQFDTSMVIVALGQAEEKYLFLYNNLMWISILYGILFIYPLTYVENEVIHLGKTTKKKKSIHKKKSKK